MMLIKQFPDISLDDTLFVFALEAEAGTVFAEVNTVFTGIGKVNAAIALTKAIAQRKPKLIVNLGSAGSQGHGKGEVVCCTRFVQRDMDVTPLGFARYETPLSDIPVLLEHGEPIPGLALETCGTGDNFETSHGKAPYDVVDMEAYVLALIARSEGIPFVCLKYISDDAGSEAADDWSVQVHLAAEAFKRVLFS
ncbi:nucleosidase [Pseudomonas sp. P1B16]|uniref:5'-methylthioadenosine/S-adenosylhomocysteine nucleosidase family protein n=1 Tax=Pseudomonas TaxID=286 RepID=UPI0004D6A53B|nr:MULTISPECIES: nucleosidase [Pseudomonas]KEY88515.1 nucleosidase [Pseudomonas capeferrum]KGI92609.1 nucleosidase [Pseudomonas sp. H2]MBC3479620.1 nucleosidase [Pseudomonas sp. SWRI77]MBC3502415.1 nucleosidase [Pseudomonas sp. SWRI59]MBC3509165.1 nucleosidase [Pseudomonas sp. SWRI68]